MKEKNQVVPDEVLSKEFLSQFKTEADVSKLSSCMPKYWKKCLKVKWMLIWVMKRILCPVIIVVIHVMAAIQRKSRPNMGEAVISIPRDRNGQFEPIAVPKHESRGLSIEKFVISLYAKGMSVSDIEEEMREIYEIELSTSAISIITNKVNQAAQEWAEPSS